ncbi:MAG: protein-S-isoprenylcysteine O-methyltransferase Ste14 [Cryomorphaceae bacterium]|jgi:protein-S-isoprenylcysteine O-methyltransferase Ste14
MNSTVHKTFNNVALRRFALKTRYPMVLLLLVAIAYFSRYDYFWWGFAISCVGGLLQMWCFACLEKERVLAQSGPYMFCRNPMYIARYFLILGIVVILHSPLLVVIYSVFYYYYMVNRVKREELVLADIFGESYVEYCGKVNRFLPSFKAVDQLDGEFGKFNFPLMLHNNGHLNILSVLLIWAYLHWSIEFAEALFV